MRTRLEITNRSRWPDGALRVIAQWVCKRSGLGTDRIYRLVFRNTTRNTYGGLGGRHEQSVTLHRRYCPPGGQWPYETKDTRFKWSQKEIFRSRLELLVFLVAHEAHHGTNDGHPFNNRRNGRVRAASMEYRCNQAGLEAVRDFHDEWPRLFGEIKREMRKDRERRAKAKAATPRRRLAYARRMLQNWESKPDSRKTRSKIKHYHRMVTRHENQLARIAHGSRPERNRPTGAIAAKNPGS